MNRRIRYKYNKLSIEVKAALWFTICNVLQRGIQFLATPIYTRVLSTEEYGNYSLFMTWLNIFIIFGTLNMSAGIYYNGLIKNKKNVEKYTSSLQLLSSICTIFFFLAVFIFDDIFPGIIGLPKPYILLIFLYILFQPAMGFWSSQKRVTYKYRPLIAITLLISILSTTLGIFLIYVFNLQSSGLIIAYIVVNVTTFSVLYFRNLYKGKFYANIKEWKETLAFSVPLIPHYLSQVILGQFDRIMISYFFGQSKAGIYTLAYQVGLVLSILVSGINSAFTPWFYQQLKISNIKKIKKNSSELIILITVISFAIILFAPEIVYVLGTSEYKEAIWVIPPVVISTVLTFVYCIFGNYLFYYEETNKVSFATTLGAIINIALNYICIPKYGFIAAGYTTVFSYFIIFILYYLFMVKCCKRNHIQIPFTTKHISLMCSFIFAGMFICLFLYHFSVIRYIAIGFIMFICFLLRKRIIDIISTIKRGG